MKQPEQGGRYIYDPEKDALTKVEPDAPEEAATATPTETPVTPQQPAGPARKR